tara:strand:- start:1853 stop:4810 length:2958 start_codon:yes stop_codon:yes gene_type:complete
MSARKYKFVSPGVFLKEIDKSQIPRVAPAVGPLIIGRTAQGPAMRPVRVESFEEFVRVFGSPVPGCSGDDVWRDGNGFLAPTYASYAAQAYLAAGIDVPVNIVRLLGVEHPLAQDPEGKAGWKATKSWGLFLVKNTQNQDWDATLGGIIYTNETDADFRPAVIGQVVGTGGAQLAATDKQAIARHDGNENFRIRFVDNSGNTPVSPEIMISWKRGQNFIREVLNTNPVMTNAQISSAREGSGEDKYWLGETFEDRIRTDYSGNYGLLILPLNDSTGQKYEFGNHRQEAKYASTSWFFSQDKGLNTAFAPLDASPPQKLFRLCGLSPGDDLARSYKVTIEDIRLPNPDNPGSDPYGSFSVVIKSVADRNKQGEQVIEVFSNCNLNPSSSDYIARKIGDTFYTWDSLEERYKYYGNYRNRSDLVRVEVNADVDSGNIDPSLVPFGAYGPIAPVDKTLVTSGNQAAVEALMATDADSMWLAPFTGNNVSGLQDTGGGVNQITFKWPKPQYMKSIAADQLANAYWGHSSVLIGSDGVVSSSRAYNTAHADHTAIRSTEITKADGAVDAAFRAKNNYVTYFSLDDIIISGADAEGAANAGENIDLSSGRADTITFSSLATGEVASARQAGTSYSALHSAYDLLTMGVDQFQAPFYGGSDGVNIIEADPFNNRILSASGVNAKNSYAYASVERAILSAKNPEVVECNVMAMPGITEEKLTSKLVQQCETRADALAIIDLPDVYIPAHQIREQGGITARLKTTAKQSAKALQDRGLTSSYGCAYYPWVKIADTINDSQLWVPPSVVALGVFGFTEERNEIWFAPAGFNRGGLDKGNAGLKVLNTTEHLTSKERDVLYEANINPIAKFPSEGIVIFGQKTLQTTQSALDRINVRRLLIFLKKEISRIAANLLFDQNVPATWNRFLGLVTPFLSGVQSRLGLSDYKVILDETTTTPDLVDRNIMYAKIFLKPARAIEFIAIDFIITNTGASFED